MAFNSSLFQSYSIGTNGYPQIYLYQADADSFAAIATANYFADLVNKVVTGDKLICNTTTAGLSFSGTFLNDGTTVSINWDNTLHFETQMADVSTASTVYFSVPPAGIITQVYGVQWSAVTVASSVVTFSIGTTAITGGAFTVTTSGVAGTAYSATPTALNTTNGTSYVKAASDGGSTTTAIMTLGYKIVCPTQI